MVDVSRHSQTPLVQLMRWTIWSGLATFAAVALLLATQRLFAASARTLDPLATVVLVAIAASLALLFRLPQGRAVVGNSSMERWGILLAPGICLLLLGIAVSSPEMPPAALVLVWLFICAEEGFLMYRERANFRWQWPSRSAAAQHPSPRPLSDPAPTVTQLSDQADGEIPTHATQSMLRTRDADTEEISGTLRTDLRPGERTVYAHVGFCPPLAATPRIEAEQTDGPEATIKLGQVLPHGARFDVRLQSASEEAVRVELAFHAVAQEPPKHEGTEAAS